MKKPKLDQHRMRCHSGYDCIDCSTTFNTPADYKGHTSCISEAEKYQKSLYKGPKTVCTRLSGTRLALTLSSPDCGRLLLQLKQKKPRRSHPRKVFNLPQNVPRTLSGIAHPVRTVPAATATNRPSMATETSTIVVDGASSVIPR